MILFLKDNILAAQPIFFPTGSRQQNVVEGTTIKSRNKGQILVNTKNDLLPRRIGIRTRILMLVTYSLDEKDAVVPGLKFNATLFE
jgi:ribosome biogenesis GTPase A